MQRGISVELLATSPVSVKGDHFRRFCAILSGLVYGRWLDENSMCSTRSALGLYEPLNAFVLFRPSIINKS